MTIDNILNDFINHDKDFLNKDTAKYTEEALEEFKKECTIINKYFYVYDKYLINFLRKTACPLNNYSDDTFTRSSLILDKGGYKNHNNITNEIFNTKIKVLSLDELETYDFTELIDSLKENYDDFEVLSIFHYLSINNICLSFKKYDYSDLIDKVHDILIFYRNYFN